MNSTDVAVYEVNLSDTEYVFRAGKLSTLENEWDSQNIRKPSILIYYFNIN